MRLLREFLSALWLSVLLVGMAHADTVRLANGEWAPYMSKSLKEGGFMTQFIKEVSESEGYQVEFEYLPWKRGYEETKAGNFDATFIWGRSDERAQDFYFSDTVITLSTALFQQKSKPIMWNSREELGKYRIGGVTGYAYGIEDLEEQGKITVQRISDADNNYKKLSAGRLDIVLEDMDVGMEFLNNLKLTDKLEPNSKALAAREYVVLFSKNSPKAKELKEAFNRGLNKLISEGRLDAYREASTRGEYK
ncbi:TPA: transporter substrate-binding domain-containing protein [Vibrio vulnificus]|nr:transporter substrate-binding domain-containing protein [Vibrio vulnificus]HDY7574206.1 transporter substrate-binding domain-containing protein [Vibrio vulnificus]